MENSLLIWVNVPLSFKWLCNYFQEMFHLWHLELYLFITLSNYSQQPCDMQYIIKTGQYHAKISFIKNSMKPPSISSNLNFQTVPPFFSVLVFSCSVRVFEACLIHFSRKVLKRLMNKVVLHLRDLVFCVIDENYQKAIRYILTYYTYIGTLFRVLNRKTG